MMATEKQAVRVDVEGSAAESVQLAESFELIGAHLAAIESIVRNSPRATSDVLVDLTNESHTLPSALEALQRAVEAVRVKLEPDVQLAHEDAVRQESAIRRAIRLVGERLHARPIAAASDIRGLVQQLDSGALDEVLEKATERAGVSLRPSAVVRRFEDLKPFSLDAWKQGHKP